MNGVIFHKNILKPLDNEGFLPMHTDGRVGVNIREIFHDAGENGSRLALVKYDQAALVPEHIHTGYEVIFVIEGVLSDNYGNYTRGELIVYRPDSAHSLHTKTGCIFLVLWDKPVERVGESAGEKK
ncbi:TPA: cupin domain-containing protein [Vibrio vulnificus]|jgi:anti-sigma factor ChrR (cupin superfamily)|uniref:Cupin domain-containing protein n=1 Tax=Vibrio neptunius TaxID=170651 RepID=A0ABS3A7S6_9VIBR|nr:cupin domain-containing protein [Vibrio neptunius]HDY7993048.1 cupin domain-containing protein [Vibrio vulnificus]MBN3495695.1 cupin domain-containing protein [Vibrio neptunius]MBN3518140.1 cupin domain-containing protein [Vibrio neptunius]MBN3552469.1 cupin domain-containing protein [Vibrio neptunius]MBN3580526.1 cupin domain-containing protein [Vibrio neptunius]